jgi:hypothetical protein
MIGSLGNLGTVHPHDPFALMRMRGSSPVFVNSKSFWIFSPSVTVPKLNSVALKLTVVVGPSDSEVLGESISFI